MQPPPPDNAPMDSISLTQLEDMTTPALKNFIRQCRLDVQANFNHMAEAKRIWAVLVSRRAQAAETAQATEFRLAQPLEVVFDLSREGTRREEAGIGAPLLTFITEDVQSSILADALGLAPEVPSPTMFCRR